MGSQAHASPTRYAAATAGHCGGGKERCHICEALQRQAAETASDGASGRSDVLPGFKWSPKVEY